MSDGLTEALRGTFFLDNKYLFVNDRTTDNNITSLNDNEIFVFGSNLKGIHGKGAAKSALKWGAKYGQGVGIQGKTYAIPTKDEKLNVLSLKEIKVHINNFIAYSIINRDKIFLVTKIGTGLSGYSYNDIAPLFKDTKYLENIKLPKDFWDIILL